MKKRLRLTRRRDFTAVLSAPRLHAGQALIGFVSERGLGPPRIGVTVSRKVRGAVARNRAKRRLREVVRQILLDPGSPLLQAGIKYDVVLIARPAALEVGVSVLEADARSVLAKLAARNRSSGS